jgi:phage shock protein E
MKTIDTTRLASSLRGGQPFTLIDVLPAEEHERGHIPRSVNVPLSSDHFARDVSEHVGRLSDPVVLYASDASSDATRRAALLLASAGFSEVYDLEGGLAAWKEAGQPLVSAPPTPASS